LRVLSLLAIVLIAGFTYFASLWALGFRLHQFILHDKE
ncbi:MAG: hypothetical protein K0R94_1175, partial [Burkholderiales bacterium]|nr:hypothetical protein [Burkholderiales bacterium]